MGDGEEGMRSATRLSRAVGLIISIGGVLGIVGCTLILRGAWAIAITTVFSVVLSIGLISLVYEIWLRSEVAGELLALVRLKESVERSGLREIVVSSHMDWADLFLRCNEFTLLPRDIATFASREWLHVLEAGRARKVDVHLLLPSTTGNSLGVLEAHLGMTLGSLVGIVTDARDSMLKAWDSATNSEPPLRIGSSLTVYEYDEFPGCAVFATDTTVAIELSATLARQPGDQGVTLLFDAKRNSQYFAWAIKQIDRARGEEKKVDIREVS